MQTLDYIFKNIYFFFFYGKHINLVSGLLIITLIKIVVERVARFRHESIHFCREPGVEIKIKSNYSINRYSNDFYNFFLIKFTIKYGNYVFKFKILLIINLGQRLFKLISYIYRYTVRIRRTKKFLFPISLKSFTDIVASYSRSVWISMFVQFVPFV